MKLLTTFLLLLLSSLAALGQTLQPTEKEALLTLYFSTRTNQPLQEEVTLKAKNSGKEFKGTPDAQGKWQVLVPAGDTYSVYFKNGQKQDEFVIAKKPFYGVSKRIIFNGSDSGSLSPSLDQALIKFMYVDLDDKPLEDEEFIMTSLKTGKKYSVKTKGTTPASLLVPIGDKYNLSVKYDTNYRQLEVRKEPNLYTINVKYKSIGSKAWEARLKEKARRLAEREAAWKAGTWSLPQRDTVVTSVFRRNFGGNKRLIITDVTGSMYPYVDQVLHWYELNYAQAGTNQFVMFNDGDDTPDEKKIIGNTGGIYYCKYCKPKELLQTMRKAMDAGGGGDGPENNMEALLKGLKWADPFDRIIMIADNYADVKDLVLLNQLKQLKVPVHIILCGVDQDVNEDYLNIAYQTGGSVHTMEQDIEGMTKLVEGAKVRIGKNYYMLQNGRFYLYKQ